MTDYIDMLTEGHSQIDNGASHLEYISEHIFGFVTYDSAISEELAIRAIDVCKAISDKKTFDYIADTNNYRWFILMCNMPFFFNRLQWGSSIRGAWWDVHAHNDKIAVILETCGLFLDGKQITELTFDEKQWLDFISALIMFAGHQEKG
jgi:hypothetical protein